MPDPATQWTGSPGEKGVSACYPLFPRAVQKFLDRHAPAARVGRVSLQPLFEVLFRTEEVVDASTASLEHERPGRRDFLDPTALDRHGDALDAVGTGIYDLHHVVLVSAVDQQQEIHRSSDFKRVAAVHLDQMRVEIDARRRPPGKSLCDPIVSVLAFPVRHDDAQLPQELEPATHLPGRKLRLGGDIVSARR